MKFVSVSGSTVTGAGKFMPETFTLLMSRGGFRLKPMVTTVTRPGLREMIKLLRRKGYTSIYPQRKV